MTRHVIVADDFNQNKEVEQNKKQPLQRKRSVEEDVGYWPDPDRNDQEKLREM